MKVLITAVGETWEDQVDPRFGRAGYFFVYDEDSDTVKVVDNHEAGAEAHGAGTKAAGMVADIEPDVIITGNGPGGNAASVLLRLNIGIYTGAAGMTLKEAYEAWKNGVLQKN